MHHHIHTRDLVCGSRLLVIQTPGAPACVLHSYVRSGYRFTKPWQYELPHLLEHLAFDGNVTYPTSDDFAYAIERYGVYKNAYTNKNLNWYHFECARDVLSHTLQFALCQITEPLFRDEDIAHQKETIYNELSRLLEEPRSLVGYYGDSILVPKPTFEERLDIVRSLLRQDILDFFDQYYVNANFFFTIAGDIDAAATDELAKIIETKLSTHPRGQAAPLVSAELSEFHGKIITHDSPVKSQSQFYVTFPSRPADSASSAALKILQILYTVGQASRAYRARKLGLTYGVGSGFDTLDVDYSDFTVSDTTRPEHLLPLFDFCMQELSALVRGEFSDLEFERAVGYAVGTVKRSFQSPGGYLSFYAREFALGRECHTIETYLSELQSMTRERLAEVARVYFAPHNWCLSLMGQGLEGSESQYRAIMEKYFS